MLVADSRYYQGRNLTPPLRRRSGRIGECGFRIGIVRRVWGDLVRQPEGWFYPVYANSGTALASCQASTYERLLPLLSGWPLNQLRERQQRPTTALNSSLARAGGVSPKPTG